MNWRRVGQPSSGVSDGYTWDTAGSATDFEFVVSNRYDHLGRRVQKITPATTSNSSTPNSSTCQLYVPFYDANGNVMGWLSGIPDS